MSCMTVEFPQPEGPTKATVLSLMILRLNPDITFTSGLEGYRKCTSLNSMCTVPASVEAAFEVQVWKPSGSKWSIFEVRLKSERRERVATCAFAKSGRKLVAWPMPIAANISAKVTHKYKTLGQELKKKHNYQTLYLWCQDISPRRHLIPWTFHPDLKTGAYINMHGEYLDSIDSAITKMRCWQKSYL